MTQNLPTDTLGWCTPECGQASLPGEKCNGCQNNDRIATQHRLTRIGNAIGYTVIAVMLLVITVAVTVIT